MRRIILSSVAALTTAFAFAGCDYNDGDSYRRAPNQTTQVERGGLLENDARGYGGGGSAGSSDPGQIQTGSVKPYGMDVQRPPAESGAVAADPNGDEMVQGQGTDEPGVTGDTLNVNDQRKPSVGTEDRSTSVR